MIHPPKKLCQCAKYSFWNICGLQSVLLLASKKKSCMYNGEEEAEKAQPAAVSRPMSRQEIPALADSVSRPRLRIAENAGKSTTALRFLYKN